MGWIARTLLWLFVINLGIAFGAGFYEARIVFPQWLVYSSATGYSGMRKRHSARTQP